MGRTPDFWDKLWSGNRYYVDESGCVYTLQGSLYRPLDLATLRYQKIVLLPGHRVDQDASYVCKCRSDSFHVRSSGSYETSARCVACGQDTVIHDG